jgi:hypothetical protein
MRLQQNVMHRMKDYVDFYLPQAQIKNAEDEKAAETT